MNQKLRDGTLIDQKDSQERLLEVLYNNRAGRCLLKLLIHPAVSRLAGRILSSRVSGLLIDPFVQKYKIDLEQFESVSYQNYNEFFARRIRPEYRPIDSDTDCLISPCDSKLTAIPIASDCHFMIKHTLYTVASLLRSKKLAEAYANGYALIFRLTVDDYHRYCYVADGYKGKNIHIPGVLHTVNPIANDYFPIYKENSREYSILRSEQFGDIIMMEVGALLVGKIVNHHEKGRVLRGQEKGYFQFGGSTVVLLLKPNMVQMDEDILENSRDGIETVVKLGERIGYALKR